METAEEFLKRETETFDDTWRTRDSTIQALLTRFAKMHVEAALKASHINQHQLPLEDLKFTLESYPLTNIK